MGADIPLCTGFLGGAGTLVVFGRLDAAVACFGAGGGLRSPGTKSKMRYIRSRMPFFSARALPSPSGTQVPAQLGQIQQGDRKF